MTGCTSGGYDQLETSPETIEQELRPAVCERRQTDLRQIIVKRILYSKHVIHIDDFPLNGHPPSTCSSTAVVLGYVGSVRRLALVDTDIIPTFDVTSVHQWIFCSARCVAISRRNQDETAPARVFNRLNICWRRALVITDAASGRAVTS